MPALSPTVHGLLERNARKFPQKEALITPSARLTYQEMNDWANQLGRRLMENRINVGDRVVILAKNNEFFLLSLFSLLKVGAIPTPVNVRCTAYELSTMLESIQATGILYESEFNQTIDKLQVLYSVAHVYNVQNLAMNVSGYAKENLNLPIQSTDVCEILFTSGTTGAPKGVVFDHERLLNLAAAISVEFVFRHNDCILTLMPLSHSAPLNAFFLAGLYSGTSHVVGSYTPELFLQLIHDEHTTFTFAAPIAYLAAAKHPKLTDFNLQSMRVFAYGGGPLALASYERVRSAFNNSNFYQVYGLTESGPNGSCLNPEEHLTKAGSIGRYPIVNMELRVVLEDGTEAAPGECGEIILAGDSLMLGYYANLNATTAVIRDGWLHTEDIAYRDEDGYVFVVDRKKNIIISGGVNIYPHEIEEVLAKHPAVIESCVVGISHPEWGQTVKAVVVVKEAVSEDELRTHVAKYLADFKCPRLYRFVAEIPRNASGKILRNTVGNL